LQSTKEQEANMNTRKVVLVVMGSISDREQMQSCWETLAELGVEYRVHVISAHRTPDEVRRQATRRNIAVIIAGAGAAAHLAGAFAAQTIVPVIGVPLANSTLSGLDALLSTVQMPAGVPVATVAIGRAGARNAALLAAQILALSDSELAARLEELKHKMKRKVKKADRQLQEELRRQPVK
jgi:phosphoribosylaminoimidazole carboxylase PurE protein